MKKLSIQIMALCSVFGFASGVMAEDCKPAPDCAALGFTQNTADCSGAALKCPWDLTKAACKAGVKPVTCAVGSLLGSDRLCYAKEFPSGIKPVGVVFDPANQLAVSPTDAGRTTWASVDWSKQDVSSLTNCTTSNMKTCDVNGKMNTLNLMTGVNEQYPAARLAYNYQPDTCSGVGFCQKGNWFLPSIRDLITIYDNMAQIDAGLKILNPSTSKEITKSANWSSNEADATTAFAANMDYGRHGGYVKNSDYFVRPVIYYGSACPISNCKNCQAGVTDSCQTCNDGYMELTNFNTNKVTCTQQLSLPCRVLNCQTCISGDSSTCKICKSGYTLQSGKCVSAGFVCELPSVQRTCNGMKCCCPQGADCSGTAMKCRCQANPGLDIIQ